jgi:hypothetical protein
MGTIMLGASLEDDTFGSDLGDRERREEVGENAAIQSV